MADDFDVAVQKWVDKAIRRSEQTLVGIALAAEARVKELTPVLTGQLRAGWSIEVSSSLESGDSARKNVRDAKLGDVLRIVNGAAYARRIEYGFVGTDSLGRKYNQKGVGMVAQTLKELPAIADRVVAEINKSD